MIERRRSFVTQYRIAAVAILLLNALDLVTTYAAFSKGAEELNVISAFFIEHSFLGIPLIFYTKGLICGGICFGAWWVPKHKYVSLMSITAAWWVAGVYSLVVVLNSLHYFGVGQ